MVVGAEAVRPELFKSAEEWSELYDAEAVGVDGAWPAGGNSKSREKKQRKQSGEGDSGEEATADDDADAIQSELEALTGGDRRGRFAAKIELQ